MGVSNIGMQGDNLDMAMVYMEDAMRDLEKSEYSLEETLTTVDDYVLRQTVEDALESISDISANISDTKAILDYVLAYMEA